MTRTRRGFTMVELLVVMSLVIALAGIAVAVSESGAFGSQKVVSGADRASGWLLIAKQRALRDGRPRGVRFLLTQEPGAQNTATPNWQAFSFAAREAQYIEAPDLWVPNPTGSATGPQLVMSVPATGPARVYFYYTSANDLTEFQGRGVTTKDMVVVNGSSFLLSGVPAAPTTSPGVQVQGTPLTASNALELPIADLTGLVQAVGLGAAQDRVIGGGSTPTVAFGTSLFAIQPAARPLVGEPLLQLTGNTVIDVRSPALIAPFLTASPKGYIESGGGAAWPRTSFGLRLQPVEAFDPASGSNALPQFFDLLFAPSGQVLGTDAGVIALWVRNPDRVVHPRLSDPTPFATGNPGLDQSATFDAAGEQVLVVVSPRTGLIATQPVTRGGDPHAAAKDGINSGL